MSEKISTLIVDDHDYFRRTLKEYLGEIEAITIVGEAKNGKEAVALTEALEPRLIIMDIHMPIMDGLTAHSLIKTKNSAVQVVLYSMYDIHPFGSSPGQNGGIYLPKDRVFEDLPKVIERVKKGLKSKEDTSGE